MSDAIAIGVDVGGTKIAFAAVDHKGQLLSEKTMPTQPEDGQEAVIERIAKTVEAIAAQISRPIAGVGVACPGPVDPVAGVALSPVNLGWQNVPMRDLLRTHLTSPVWLQNDVNAGALGEMIFGAARGSRDFVYLAIGTGLGGGAVFNGQIINGVTGCAMEVGHLSLDVKGRLCNCGNRGCVEMYISGKGLLAGTAEHLPRYPESLLAKGSLSTGRIIDAARTGDRLARAVMDEAADALGITLAWCATVLNPPLIVIGGGLARAAGDLLLERAQRAMRARVLSPVWQPLKLALSEAQSSALGAAALVWSSA